MQLSGFPRFKLADFPTPLEPLPTLSLELGIKLFVKRDDLISLAFGGNKVRKLEFLVGDVLSKAYDAIVTTGALHSNHARLTAAACVKAGLRCILVLRGKDSRLKGNLLLDHLLGAEVRTFDAVDDKVLAGVVDELSAQGARPYFIPAGGATSIGALGYVDAALEILEQSKESDINFDYVVHPTGTAATQTGLLMGLASQKAGAKVLGVSNGPPSEVVKQRIHGLLEEAKKLPGLNVSVNDERIAVFDDYTCGGYGVITREVVDTMKLVARKESLILDPVYTGKGFLGLVGLKKRGIIEDGATVLFLHTGGGPITFQYDDQVSAYL